MRNMAAAGAQGSVRVSGWQQVFKVGHGVTRNIMHTGPVPNLCFLARSTANDGPARSRGLECSGVPECIAHPWSTERTQAGDHL